jgi:hypothetical protein
MDRATTLSGFPSYDWVFGCSAVSQAMIAAYYDNNGYPSMYTGPTNGGVMPLTDTSWASWSDGSESYPNNPLIASHSSIDGYVGRGTIDDYWVGYGSSANDPYITNGWTEHAWGTAVGDYMKTSQSAYGNVDGSTRFWNFTTSGDKLYCSDLYSAGPDYYTTDGTYGRKLFFEARGYSLTECYNQNTSNNVVSGGFSLTDFQSEIDAGYPVLLNLEGHSIVGFGYNGTTIYIRDTWSSDPSSTPTMIWDSTPSYLGMNLLSVSVIHLEEPSSVPGTFAKGNPSNEATAQPTNLSLSWGTSSQSYGYQYCYDTTNDNNCSNWTDVGFNTSVSLSGLSNETTYYWQIRAINPLGTTFANGSSTTFWSFTTMDAPTLSEKMFLPLIVRN